MNADTSSTGLTQALQLHQGGELQQAEQAYRVLLEKEPEHFNARQLLGTVLAQLGRHAEAVEHLRAAIAIDDSLAGVHHNLGNALQSMGLHPEAIAAWSRALEIDPTHAEALAGKGRSLRTLARWSEALVCFEGALALRPDTPALHFARADALQALKRFTEAAKAYAQVLARDDRYKYAAGAQYDCLRHACDWSVEADARARILAQVHAGHPASSPFRLLNMTDSGAAQLACARLYVQDRYPPSPESLARTERSANARLRVAYLSAEFRSHATMFLMAELLEKHDHRKFEWFAFSFGPPGEDSMRARLVHCFDHFIDVSAMTDLEVAHAIRDAGIDIAVDLKGFTQHCRPGILSHRPAPIQVNYLGYPGTMGADYVDYIVADETVVPRGDERFFSEKVVRLPDSYQPNDRRRPIADTCPSRSELGLPERGFVFCCFNNSYKITPAVFAIWMRLLAAVEGSVLWLLSDSAEAVSNLRREARLRGVDPERLVFAPRVEPEAHLARHRVADLFLDTLPINAHTTASDALWAGLPLLTCMGESFASRVAASLLRAVGLPELVTADLAAYERTAMEVAQNPAQLRALKTRLHAARETAPLFDTNRYRGHLEAAYLGMQTLHRQGLAPQSFDVSPMPRSPALQLRPTAQVAAGEETPADSVVRKAIDAAAEGRHADAVARLRQVLTDHPDHVAALGNLATSLEALGQLDEALRTSERCVTLCPEAPEIAFNHAGLLARVDRVDEAIALYSKVVAQRPEWASAHNNLGHALFRQQRYEEALVALDAAVAVSPAFVQALQNRAATLAALGLREQALAGFERILAVDPENAQARTDRALQLLSLGRLGEAWIDLDHRWRNPTFTARHAQWPQETWWRGDTPLVGRTLLVHAEQGLGDTLQFARYVPMLAAAGARVLLQVQGPLQRLMSGMPGVAQVFSREDPLPEFDLHCPMMSLPRAFATELHSIPDTVPYLEAPAVEHRQWAQWLADQLPGQLRVGLVWSGNPEHARDASRSISLDVLSPLLETQGVGFVSLQTQVRAADEELLAAETRIVDASPWLQDFADTAGLVANLDLVITVDTSPAHLAGALGVPVWMMLSTVLDWRWAPDGDSSRWYPSTRLYRQSTRGAWTELIERVRDGLLAWSRAATPSLGEVAQPGAPIQRGCNTSRALVRAAALQREGRTEAAEALYRAVLSDAPDNFDATHMLGVLAAQQRRFHEAESLLQRAVALQATAPALSNLGNTLDSLGRTQDALEAFGRAIALDPLYLRARLNRGNVLLRTGRLDEALRDYTEVERLSPGNPEARQGCARVLNAQGANDVTATRANR